MKWILLLVFFLAGQPVLFGTHLKGGQITIVQTGASTFDVTVTAYRNKNSPFLFSNGGGGILDFGDGSAFFNPPQQVGDSISPLITRARVTVSHTFSIGTYLITYTEQNLNAGLLNLTNSVTTPFVIQANLTVAPGGNYSSPSFPEYPIFSFPLGQSFSMSVAAVDQSHPAYYKLVTPAQATGFSYPDSMSLNPYSGILKWDTKFNGQYIQGEFLIAVRCFQYDDDYKLMGWNDRIFDLIIEDSDSRITVSNPIGDVNGRIVIPDGSTKSIKIILQDSTTAGELTWHLQLDSTLLDNVQFSQDDSSSAVRKIKVGIFSFHTTTPIVRDNYYRISLRGSVSGPNPADRDINFIIFTKDIPLVPPPPDVIAGIATEGNLVLEGYPNPFHSSLSISGITHPGASVVFKDSRGVVILQTSTSDSLPLDTTVIPAGFFIVEVRDGNRMGSIKMVKN